MKKFINILTGFIFIIGDLISLFYSYLIGAIKLFLTGNRKNNEFVALFAKKCFFIDFMVYIGVFVLLAQFTVLGAILGTFIFSFWFYSFKENWYRGKDEFWADSSSITAMIISQLIIIIFSLYLYAVTPYQYEEIGKITLVESDITYTYKQNGEDRNGTRNEVDFDYNNETSDANIRKCKPGNHTIYEETVQHEWFNFLASDYVLSCSGEMEVNKKLEVK